MTLNLDARGGQGGLDRGGRLPSALVVVFCVALGTSGCLGSAGPEAGVVEEALGACLNTEIACTVDADCARACGVGTCEAGLGNRCRICAQDAGTPCRAGAGACDVPEVCDGVRYECPADGFAAATTECRVASGACDVAERCTGASAACPADGFSAAGSVCRAAAGACDVAETCSGTAAACPALDARQAAGVVCRAAVAGGCDVAEACDGAAAACPADGFVAAGTECRASAGPCDRADVCTGTSTACADARQTAGTVCRSSAGPCDLQEVCNGTLTTCPADAFSSAAVVCRASTGPCDRADQCTGTSAACTADVLEPTTTVCRAAGGACDVAERCSGTAVTCPADVLLGAGTTCRALAGTCDVAAETCSGTAAACPADMLLAAGTVCRAAAPGGCDRQETCTGTLGACPVDTFLPATTVCRAGTAPCDAAETCPGTGPLCPADALAVAGTTCRAATDLCDLPETCSGTDTTCPAATSAVRPGGFVCRAAVAGGCDLAEVCDGMASSCPANILQPPGTVCRAAVAGGCDVAESCTGASTTCPPNAFAGPGTVCRAALGPCDRPESCTGTLGTCPANTRFPPGTVCRASAGACDVAESCAGTVDTCPADAFLAAGALCRAASGTCDQQEVCAGGTAACPGDALLPAGALCRGTAGPCDALELCTGTVPACPVDAFAAAGTSCRPAAGPCDLSESCSGGGVACPANAFVAAGSVCRAATGSCDPAESCGGASASCPADASAVDGTACDPDGDVCNGSLACMSGACRGAGVPLDCDDGNPCTADSCDPVAGCRHTPTATGMTCDDGRYCTVGDTCRAGSCTGDPRDCGAASEACLVVECDESTDRCREAPNPDGTACVDRNIKPHMMVILDNSGTMSAASGAGMNSCGRERTRISDAKCVLSTVVGSYGDIVFGLERFTQTTSGSCGGTCPAACGGGTCPTTCSSCSALSLNCSSCDPSAASGAAGGCPAVGGTAAQGEILAPLVDDNQASILRWVDNRCDSCSRVGTNPELAASLDVFTPLAGSLRAARRYYEGTDPSYPSPIDPARTCTPYYVVLITDGTEACTTYADAVAAARELRTTRVGAATFDVRTYTIGVGIAPGSFNAARLGEIAAAGGTTPFFASDEDALSLAFSRILEDSLLVELCNGTDDDCDSRVDEGYTLYCNRPEGVTVPSLCADPGDPCDGADDNCAAGTADEVRNACGVCGPLPLEVCDRLDNDCDGRIDEPPADCSCIAEPELCDGRDNDCDGVVDDGLARPCGSDVGACTRGTQVCVAGAWAACSGAVPGLEVCDGVDNDCDGVIDGLSRPCGADPVGICTRGIEVCVAGAFGACTGGVSPGAEFCDGLDNDCDGAVDETDPGLGAVCETTCGTGEIRCVDGGLACVAGGGSAMAEVCNGYDEDCDGRVDESVTLGGPCDGGGLLCVPGMERCVDGAVECIGGSAPEPEVCDCRDNDCDDVVDDGATCAGDGARCLASPHCGCAVPCTTEEFPCALGFRCTGSDEPVPGFCVRDACAGVRCDPQPDGGRTVCREGTCVPVCDTITCPSPLVCDPRAGFCASDDCYAFPDRCPSGSVCVAGECEADACAGVACPEADQFCRDGTCVGSCAGVDCAPGERCEDGACVADLCAGVDCPGELCDRATGTCVPDLCSGAVPCPDNTVCEAGTGRCVRDPCLGVACPAGAVCDAGDCVSAEATMDAGVSPGEAPGRRVLAAGGGGCVCRIGVGGASGRGAAWLSVLLAGLVMARRRRVGTRNGAGR